MDSIDFFKEYHRAVAYYYKGLELVDVAKENGAGMGLAASVLWYSIGILEKV